MTPSRRVALAMPALLPLAARAQEGALRVIIPQPPGGATDILARVLVDALAAALGRPVIIENRPGANGIVSINALRQSRPDGNTVLLGGVSIFSFNPNLFPNLPYDPFRDFTWVAPVADTPFVMVTGRRTGLTTMAQFVERARAQPERITYGSAGIGNSTHLAMEMIAERANIRLTHVPFAGSAPAMTSIIAGDTDSMVIPLGSAVPNIQASQVNALVTLGAERAPALPQVPTLRETGFGDVVMPGWYAFVGPAGMAAPVVERLDSAIRSVVQNPAVVARLREQVLEPIPGTAAEIQARARRESDDMAAFIRRRGIRVE
ncbi:MAG: tripartite tricarboxylate transporter substrate binding protein [Acetobacteraceae bacterium]|nr:tripartite tricarboxylate transporter substrate binding protein [Acetobacteraceae bacterium]